MAGEKTAGESEVKKGEEIHGIPIGKDIYRLMRFIVRCYIGVPHQGYSTKEEMEKYVEEVCEELDEAARKDVTEELQLTLNRRMRVRVLLHKAYHLPPSDADLLSDPYCLLCIDPAKTKRSKTINKDLYPTWNQTIFLDIPQDEDYNLVPMLVEVWDEDPKTFREEIAGWKNLRIRGISTCVQDLYGLACSAIHCGHADDFLGALLIPLSRIDPGPKYLNLYSARAGEMLFYYERGIDEFKRVRRQWIKVGRLKLQVWFEGAPQPDRNYTADLQQHYLLYKVCFSHCPRETDQQKTLVYLHQIQNNISDLEDCIICWLALLWMHEIKMRIMSFLAMKIELEKILEELLEVDFELNPWLVQSLNESLVKVANYCLPYLKNLQRYLHKKDISITSFDEMLGCLCAAYNLNTSLISPLVKTAIEEESEWYFTNAFVYFKDSEAKTLKAMCQVFLASLEMADLVLERGMAFSYSCFAYKSVDKVMSTRFRRRLLELCMKTKMEVFLRHDGRFEALQSLLDVYKEVRDLARYLKKSRLEEQPLEIESYQHWFGEEFMSYWFQMVTIVSIPFIEREVMNDKLLPVEEGKCGTSVVYFCDVTHAKLVQLMKYLDWYDKPRVFAVLMQEMCNCVDVFIKSLRKRNDNKLFSDISTEKRCVALNGLMVVESHLLKLRENLLSSLPSDRATTIAKVFVDKRMQGTKRRIRDLADELAKSTASQVSAKINVYIEEIIDSINETVTETAYFDLRTTVNRELRTVYTSITYDDVFHDVFCYTWQCCLAFIERRILHSASEQLSFPQRLLLCLEELFFGLGRINVHSAALALEYLQGEFSFGDILSEDDMDYSKVARVKHALGIGGKFPIKTKTSCWERVWKSIFPSQSEQGAEAGDSRRETEDSGQAKEQEQDS